MMLARATHSLGRVPTLGSSLAPRRRSVGVECPLSRPSHSLSGSVLPAASSTKLPPIVALVGPTAAGKSRVAASVAAQVNGELVSVDSVKLYRGLDIGSNKSALLSHAHARGLRVHLVDVADARTPWSLGQFVRAARAAVADIRARGRVPVLVGGTAFYVEGLLGLVPLSAPPRDEALSRAIEAELRDADWDAALAQLARVDAASAQRIARNDWTRLVRALEIHRATGQPRSAYATRAEEAPYALGELRTFLATRTPRPQLYADTDRRCERMLQRGLVHEVDSALRRGALSLREEPAGNPGPGAAIGYAHVLAILRAERKPTWMDASALVSSFAADTRHLARRQLSYWRRSELPLRWTPLLEAHESALDELAARIAASVHVSADEWAAELTSEPAKSDRQRCGEADVEERRALRRYLPYLTHYDAKTRAGREALEALAQQLQRAHANVWSASVPTRAHAVQNGPREAVS